MHLPFSCKWSPFISIITFAICAIPKGTVLEKKEIKKKSVCET